MDGSSEPSATKRSQKVRAARRMGRRLRGSSKSKATKGGKAPTIKDVAERAQVAPGTVSNVLTGRRPVAEDLRRKVLKAVDALDYRPNQIAASLRTQQTRSIGIVVPDLKNPFFAELVYHIDELAATSNYQTLLVGSNETEIREVERIQALIARRVDGLIIAPTRDGVSEIALPPVARFPTVFVDRGFGFGEFDTITADSRDAGYRGARHLLDLGHRDIAILMTTAELTNISDRVEGCCRALAEAGLADRKQVIGGSWTIEGCRRALEPALLGMCRPTAVFAMAYVATLGAIQAIRRAGLAFPEEISVLGFDDSEWMTALHPYVSTVRQPVKEIASLAWNRLSARIAGKGGSPFRVQLPCTLEVRESTLPPAVLSHRRTEGSTP
jgi:LacI family transcriptional regulator